MMNQGPEKSEAQVKKEIQGEAGNLIVFDLRTLSQFKEEGPSVQVLSDIEAARVVLFGFKAGQQLPEHVTASQILVQALRGRITFTTAASSIELQAGMLVQVEANVPHRVVAQTDAVMLVTMTPSPSYHSLEHEVYQHLSPLVTRLKSD